MRKYEMSQHDEQHTIGIWYTAIAYMMWGFLPLYWKLLEDVAAIEILAHRIIWSFVFVLFISFYIEMGNFFKGM
jgi:chloramphenicol-sensitive protein RarD